MVSYMAREAPLPTLHMPKLTASFDLRVGAAAQGGGRKVMQRDARKTAPCEKEWTSRSL